MDKLQKDFRQLLFCVVGISGKTVFLCSSVTFRALNNDFFQQGIHRFIIT